MYVLIYIQKFCRDIQVHICNNQIAHHASCLNLYIYTS